MNCFTHVVIILVIVNFIVLTSAMPIHDEAEEAPIDGEYQVDYSYGNYYDAEADGYGDYPQYLDDEGNPMYPIDYGAYADYGELTDEELAALDEAGISDELGGGEVAADYDGYNYYDFFPAY